MVVLEAASTPGGGCRTAELTLPGYRHDVCSAVHPMGIGSPAMRALPLEEHGVVWRHPGIPLAHPVDDGAALLHRSIGATAAGLGDDGDAWRRLVGPLVDGGLPVLDELLSPLSVPHHPLHLARFARFGLRGADRAADRLRTPEARALLAGLAAHSVLPLDRWMSAGVGLVLAAYAHVVGWPVAEGGSQAITDALVAILREHGGEVVCDHAVTSLDELAPDAHRARRRVTFGARRAWPVTGCRRAPADGGRRFRRGPGDVQARLRAVRRRCRGPTLTSPRAGTVHVGGTFEEIAAAEAAAARGEHTGSAVRPRGPGVGVRPDARAGRRAHAVGLLPRAPRLGRRHDGGGGGPDRALRARASATSSLARHAMTARRARGVQPPTTSAATSPAASPTGASSSSRPVLAVRPWRTPVRNVYLCSSSTPPGGGVHGMCGYHAARTALHDAR